MAHWLITWKTWMDEEIETPWPFRLLQHTSEFRNRKTGAAVASDTVDSVFLSGNVESATKFEEENISGVLLCTVIESEDPIPALESIRALFPDAELVSMHPVPENMMPDIDAHLKKNQRP